MNTITQEDVFNRFAKDIAKILPERFIAHQRERKALSNTSTKIVYDVTCSTELTLFTLQSENTDLQVGDKIEFQNKPYRIYQIQNESRVMKRLFLKEENTYACEK